MFERFTERARQVVVNAQDVAREYGHEWIDTPHLYVGLCREEEGLAARVLASLDVGEARIVNAMEWQGKGEVDRSTGAQIPFTEPCKRALELALREALSLGHNYIGTEHILLGVLRAGTDPVLIEKLGITEEAARLGVIRAMTPPRSRPQPPNVVDPLAEVDRRLDAIVADLGKAHGNALSLLLYVRAQRSPDADLGHLGALLTEFVNVMERVAGRGGGAT